MIIGTGISILVRRSCPPKRRWCWRIGTDAVLPETSTIDSVSKLRGQFPRAELFLQKRNAAIQDAPIVEVAKARSSPYAPTGIVTVTRVPWTLRPLITEAGIPSVDCQKSPSRGAKLPELFLEH